MEPNWREVLIDCLEDRGTPHDDAVAILDSLYPRPIPVSERLPEQSEDVLWFFGDSWEVGYLDEATLDGKKWWRPQGHWDICEITPDMFWMPMPPNPPARIILTENSQSTTFDLATLKPPAAEP